MEHVICLLDPRQTVPGTKEAKSGFLVLQCPGHYFFRFCFFLSTFFLFIFFRGMFILFLGCVKSGAIGSFQYGPKLENGCQSDT